jgi:hypothetical protein
VDDIASSAAPVRRAEVAEADHIWLSGTACPAEMRRGTDAITTNPDLFCPCGSPISVPTSVTPMRAGIEIDRCADNDVVGNVEEEGLNHTLNRRLEFIVQCGPMVSSRG